MIQKIKTLLSKKIEPWMYHWCKRKILSCVKKRRYVRIIYIATKVNLGWYCGLKIKQAFTRKIRVGFGPLIEDEHEGGVRKARIDPIVKYINKNSQRYSASIFFEPEEMEQFDISVIVRTFDEEYIRTVKKLKIKNKIFLYDIVDNPASIPGCRSLDYQQNPEFIKLVNGIIASSPLHIEDLKNLNSNTKIIEHPVTNKKYSLYKKKKSIDIIWQGYIGNLGPMLKIQEIVNKLKQESNCDIKIIYNTNAKPRIEGIVKYVKWRMSAWQDILANSDIGITIKLLDDTWQQRKPSYKVIGYMAAGLPVVCTPSQADTLVIEHGKTGYFAYNDEEWYRYLKNLIMSPSLRKTMGTAAKEFVTSNFSIEKITGKYIDFFDLVSAKHESVEQR